MPTYRIQVHGSPGPNARRALASAITEAHATVTGAPRSFAQVFVETVGSGEQFVGGEPAGPGGVHVHGHIRAGRAPETLDRLVVALRDAVIATLGVREDLVWVYVSELAPERMIEFGRVLPPDGEEQAWIASMPDAVRERLKRLDGG